MFLKALKYTMQSFKEISNDYIDVIGYMCKIKSSISTYLSCSLIKKKILSTFFLIISCFIYNCTLNLLGLIFGKQRT